MKSSIYLLSDSGLTITQNKTIRTVLLKNDPAAQIPVKTEINTVAIASPVSLEDGLDFFMFRMGL